MESKDSLVGGMGAKERAQQWLDRWAPALSWNTTMREDLAAQFEHVMVDERKVTDSVLTLVRHSPFDHDFVRDEAKCSTCKLLKTVRGRSPSG